MLQKSQKIGRYEWCIDKHLTNNILSAKCGDSFDSKMFTVAQLNWILRLYPRGWDAHNNGYCGIFVQLLAMPPHNRIFCQLHIECPQVEVRMIESVSYDKPHSFGSYIASSKQLASYKPKKLTFVISIHITRITQKQNRHILYQMSNKMSKYKKNSTSRFEWKLDKTMMKRLKQYERPKGICSEIYDDIWVLKLFPNGGWCSKQSQVEIGLELCSLPRNASTLSVQWTVELKRHKAKQTLKNDFDERKSYHHWNKNSAPLSFNKFVKYDTLSICLHINILNIEYDEEKESDRELDIDLIETMEASKFEVYDASMRAMHQQLHSFENRLNKMDSMLRVIETQSDQIEALTQSVYKLSREHKQTQRELLLVSKTLSRLEENQENKEEIAEELTCLKRQITGILDTVTANKHTQINSQQEEVRQWLKMEVNLEIYFDLFIENGFDDLDTIKTLNIGILRMMPVEKIGHQMKILRCVQKLNNGSDLEYHSNEGVASTAYQ